MKIERITYGKSYELPGYWEKVAVDIQVEEGDHAPAVLDTAKNMVEKWHRDRNPDLYPDSTVIETKKEKELTGNIAEDLKTVTDIKVLESYSLICRQDADLMKIYNKQLKKLSKNDSKSGSMHASP